jgi:hypothetical protein
MVFCMPCVSVDMPDSYSAFFVARAASCLSVVPWLSIPWLCSFQSSAFLFLHLWFEACLARSFQQYPGVCVGLLCGVS